RAHGVARSERRGRPRDRGRRSVRGQRIAQFRAAGMDGDGRLARHQGELLRPVARAGVTTEGVRTKPLSGARAQNDPVEMPEHAGGYMHLIPQSWPHFHILVSVFPSVGLIFVLGLYVAAFASASDGVKGWCLVLFVILGVLALPTYVSGDFSMEALSQDKRISQGSMSSHFGWGVVALALLVLTGIAALIELWRSRRRGRLSNDALHL